MHAGRGHWYRGQVIRQVHRQPGDTLYWSPWESYEVGWEEAAGGDTTLVCPWEIEPVKESHHLRYGTCMLVLVVRTIMSRGRSAEFSVI